MPTSPVMPSLNWCKRECNILPKKTKKLFKFKMKICLIKATYFHVTDYFY